MRTYIIPKLHLPLNIYEKEIHQDAEWIRSRRREIFEILKDGYSKETEEGCFVYKKPDDVSQNADLCKVVLDENDTILAVATYRYFPLKNSYKAILGTFNHLLEEERINLAKKTMIAILKSEIINAPNKLYWMETSDRITELCRAFKAYPIPSCFVQSILGEKHQVIINSEEAIKDPYIYYRKLSDELGVKSKYMFRFDSVETYEKLLDKLSAKEYEDDLIEIMGHETYNALKESKDVLNRYGRVWKALYYIEDTYFENLGFRYITPKTKQIIRILLTDAKKLMSEELPPKYKNSLKTSYLNVSRILRGAIVLQLHEIDLP